MVSLPLSSFSGAVAIGRSSGSDVVSIGWSTVSGAVLVAKYTAVDTERWNKSNTRTTHSVALLIAPIYLDYSIEDGTRLGY